MAAFSHSRHEDHYSVSGIKYAIIASPLQKLLSSSRCVADRGVGGSLLSFLKRSSTALHGEGTLVNRPHSRGIKEPLHWFVLEAVLLICLPMNECIGPVFLLMWTKALEACINWPDVVHRVACIRRNLEAFVNSSLYQLC